MKSQGRSDINLFRTKAKNRITNNTNISEIRQVNAVKMLRYI